MGQSVLSVPADTVDKLYEYPVFHCEDEYIDIAMNAIKNFGTYVERDEAEKSSSLRQIIACCVVHKEREVLCLRRSRNSDRSVLRLRYSLLVGGHVDDVDHSADSTLSNCLRRELSEELGIEPLFEPRLLGVVADPSTTVGSLHLGVVFEVIIPSRTIELTRHHDTEEFVYSGVRRRVSLMDATQLAEVATKLDPWSKLFLRSRCCEELLNVSDGIEHDVQRYLSFRDVVLGS